MPSGSLVAGFQRRVLPNGQISPEIIFWERNGLRHGEFVLTDDQDAQVKHLSFNLDSTLLAVHCVINSTEQVLLFTRSNWKWYCKH
jgi:elongator complex protein 1